MRSIYPDFYESFHCLAGACPDTCCKDWEIILDDAATSRYEALPGKLGEAVRAALTKTPEGETAFRLQDGHCALLRPDGLCPIQSALGEAALCETCKAHPRFIEEYGNVAEYTLSISCPEAARLLLEHPAPVTFLKKENSKRGNRLCKEDETLYRALCKVRDCAISLAQNRSYKIPDRAALLLCMAKRAQGLLDGKKFSAIPALCRQFQEKQYQASQLLRLRRLRRKKSPFFPCWMVLNNMEHLTQSFPALLSRANHFEKDEDFHNRFALQEENLLVYFLFRYLPKALNDGLLLARAESCVFHLYAIRFLFAVSEGQNSQTLQVLTSLYSKEVEHSEENLSLLLRLFSRGTIPLSYLFSILDT